MGSGTLHQAFLKTLKQAPALLIEPIVRRKLKAEGVRHYRKAAKALASHLIEKPDEPFHWDEPGLTGDIALSLDSEDAKELEASLEKLTQLIPELMMKAVDSAADVMVAGYQKDWHAYRREQERQDANFRHNLQTRWGDGLDALRMLLDVSHQIGLDYGRKKQRARKKEGKLTAAALVRLHCRACQVVAEIIVLLENGFADGAMARWRTLHEIETVALIISDGGDEVAERYLDHDVVESKRAFDLYVKTAPLLKYNLPPKREGKIVNRAYDSMIKKHGEDFASPFGWASKYLKIKTPRFSQLEEAAGRTMMRSHYKMASYNVHAGAKALSFRIGVVLPSDAVLAGASNAGLEEPGQNTALSLALLNSLLLKDPKGIDELALWQALIRLRDQSVDAFIAAGRRLEQEEMENRRKRAARPHRGSAKSRVS